jgi:hypothetical protein
MKFIQFLSQTYPSPVLKKQKFNDKSDSSRIDRLKTYTINTVKYLTIQALNNKKKLDSLVPPINVFDPDQFKFGVLAGSAYASISYFINVPTINVSLKSYSYILGVNLAISSAYDGINVGTNDGLLAKQSALSTNINNNLANNNVLNETNANEYAYNIGYNNGYTFYKAVYIGISKALTDLNNSNNNNYPNAIYNNIAKYDSIKEYNSVDYYEFGYYVGYTQTLSGNNLCIYYLSYLNGLPNLYANPPQIDINILFGLDQGYNNAYIEFNNGITQSKKDYGNIDRPSMVINPDKFNPYEQGYAYGWGIEQGKVDSLTQDTSNPILSDYYIENPTPDNATYSFNLGYYYGYIGLNRFLNPTG